MKGEREARIFAAPWLGKVARVSAFAGRAKMTTARFPKPDQDGERIRVMFVVVEAKKEAHHRWLPFPSGCVSRQLPCTNHV